MGSKKPHSKFNSTSPRLYAGGGEQLNPTVESPAKSDSQKLPVTQLKRKVGQDGVVRVFEAKNTRFRTSEYSFTEGDGEATVDEATATKVYLQRDLPQLNYPTTVEGWTLEENNIYRNYICRYVDLNYPCWDAMFGIHPDYHGWPLPLQCPSGQQCCTVPQSSTTIYNPWCKTSCSGGGWPMGMAICKCSDISHRCPELTDCIDNDQKAWGGAYCQCKDGYVGDGFTCYPDPCKASATDPCSPGTCVGRPNGQAFCNCPTGYLWDGKDTDKPKCVLKDMCGDNPCGPPERVVECRTDRPFSHSCVCKPGYVESLVDGKNTCVAFDNQIKCSDDACGTQGVKSCTDTESGAVCECESMHQLVTSNRKMQCIYSPCTSNPCGDSQSVKSCTAGISSYACTCNDGYSLTTVDGLQQCVEEEFDIATLLIVAGTIGIGLLIGIIACFVLRRRMNRRNAAEIYMQGGLENMMGATYNGAGQVNPSMWM